MRVSPSFRGRGEISCECCVVIDHVLGSSNLDRVPAISFPGTGFPRRRAKLNCVQ